MKELTLSISQFRARLGFARRAARAGGRVVVTSRGLPIAEIQKVTAFRKEERWIRSGRPGPMPCIRADDSRGIAALVETDRR